MRDGSGVAFVVLAAGLLGFLWLSRRAARGLGRDAWARVRWIRWIFVAIAVVVVVTLYQQGGH